MGLEASGNSAQHRGSGKLHSSASRPNAAWCACPWPCDTVMAGRPHVCVVPTTEVLELSAELQSLGGGDIAVGRGWVGTTAAAGSAAAAAAALGAACYGSATLLADALLKDLWAWLQSGFSATVVLLGASNASAGSTASLSGLLPADIISRVGAAALSQGLCLGLTWQLVSHNGTVRDPLGSTHQPPAGFCSQQQAVPGKGVAGAQRPSSRLSREPGGGSGAATAAPCTVGATSAGDLAQVLDELQQQQQQQHDVAGVAGALCQWSEQPTALLFRLTLLARGGGQPFAILHVLQPASSQPSAPDSAQSAQLQQHQDQEQLLVKLLREVADLHLRRREGDHLLAGSKLSPLNQLAAPLVAGSARLFVAAHTGSCRSASSEGLDKLPNSISSACNQQSSSSGSGQLERQPLLSLLSAVRHIQAICTKGAPTAAAGSTLISATSAAAAAGPASWLTCKQFLQELQQQQQAEQQRRAEAAALAAAEAERRGRLQDVARQRRQQEQQRQLDRASQFRETGNVPARVGQQGPVQQQQGGHAGSPSKNGQAPAAAVAPAAAAAGDPARQDDRQQPQQPQQGQQQQRQQQQQEDVQQQRQQQEDVQQQRQQQDDVHQHQQQQQDMQQQRQQPQDVQQQVPRRQHAQRRGYGASAGAVTAEVAVAAAAASRGYAGRAAPQASGCAGSQPQLAEPALVHKPEGSRCDADTGISGSGHDALERLRRHFQELYQQTVGSAGSAATAGVPQRGTATAGAAVRSGGAAPQHPSEAAAGGSSSQQHAPVVKLHADGDVASSPSQQYRRQPCGQQEQRSIAAGVAAAEDVAMHMAAARMRAAMGAQHLQQAQQELLGAALQGFLPAGTAAAAVAASPPKGPTGNAASPSATAAALLRDPAVFSWRGASGGSPGGIDAPGRPGSGGSLGHRLTEELLFLQQQAAVRAAEAAAAAVCSPQSTPSARCMSVRHAGTAEGELEDADLASLADLDTYAPSLGALYRSPLSRMAGAAAAQCNSAAVRAEQQQQQQHGGREQLCSTSSTSAGGAPAPPAAGGMAAAAAAAGDATPQSWPVPALQSPARRTAAGCSLGGPVVSDFFKSENMPPWSPASQAPPAAAQPVSVSGPHAGQVPATDSPSLQDSSPAGGTLSAWQAEASVAGSSQRQQPQRPAVDADTLGRTQPCPWNSSGANGSGSGGSYAAAWRRGDAHHAVASSAGGRPPQSAQDLAVQAAPEGSALSGQHASPVVPVDLDPAGGGADLTGLLEELCREQRLNAILLQQLHEVQQQLAEASAMAAQAAAAAAAVQPLAPGVQDPADFNGLLAALQLERQQHAALKQHVVQQQQAAIERQLALEAQLHSQHRQLLTIAARCRAWEQQSPLAALFQRCEDEIQQAQARSQQLQEENEQLAGLLAQADLERLAGTVEQLPEDLAAVCREHQRKLLQAQSQVRRLQEEKATLQRRLQGAERRDRLAELCRRQAESGARASAGLRQQLAAREKAVEVQSLAAAEAAAEAARLRDRLQQSDAQLGRALGEKADLQDTVDSLRRQVVLLRGQLSQDRVLCSIQAPPA